MRKTQVSRKKAHFVGIGGIGISALARYFLSQGWEVFGSDSSPSPLLRELKDEGVKIKIGHRKGNLKPGVNLVIYSPAIPSDNPELKEARRLGIKNLTWEQALGKLSPRYTTIAIAGTHGKSTTTALTALVLMEAKMNPTVTVGTKIPQLGGKNFRLGKSKYLIIEADEYRNSFLHYYPYAALITNIDKEHLDYFKDLNHIKRSFGKFINNLDKEGILVLNKDSTPLLLLGTRILGARRTENKRKIIWYSLREKKLARKIKKHLKIPGEHNLSNALGVYKLAKALGVKEKDILRAFSKYHGSWRRMEYKGNLVVSSKEQVVRRQKDKPILHTTYYKLPVYDDYAHHPTEIKATLSAFREKFPKAKIICVFQPHQAERLKKLFKEFVSAFDEADALILLDVFRVAGREAKSSSLKGKNDSEILAKAIKRRKKPQEMVYLPSPSQLKRTLNKIINKKAVIVMMGAGDIVDITPRLVDSGK